MKTLFTLLILVLGMSVTAQPIMFKAQATKITVVENWDDCEIKELDTNIILTYDKDENEIKVVFEESIMKFYIRTSVSDTSGEGVDKQDYMIYECIDSNGTTCTVIASWWNDETYSYEGLYKIRWGFHYGNVWQAYYTNKLN